MNILLQFKINYQSKLQKLKNDLEQFEKYRTYTNFL